MKVYTTLHVYYNMLIGAHSTEQYMTTTWIINTWLVHESEQNSLSTRHKNY